MWALVPALIGNCLILDQNYFPSIPPVPNVPTFRVQVCYLATTPLFRQRDYEIVDLRALR